MRPAAERLAEQIIATSFSTPKIPVVHNVTADVEVNPEKIRALMIEQIYSPVRWVDCVNTMVTKGITSTLECGPGKVLSGLNKRIHAELATTSVEKPEELQAALAGFV
jgi:[acyl-carrier-protein] S-malonyltransferase